MMRCCKLPEAYRWFTGVRQAQQKEQDRVESHDYRKNIPRD
jgi:hypothetical protein